MKKKVDICPASTRDITGKDGTVYIRAKYVDIDIRVKLSGHSFSLHLSQKVDIGSFKLELNVCISWVYIRLRKVNIVPVCSRVNKGR